MFFLLLVIKICIYQTLNSYSRLLLDISSSDQEALDTLASTNPSLISQINRYFTSGPEVVLLPSLEWNYEDKPNFNDEGFNN